MKSKCELHTRKSNKMELTNTEMRSNITGNRVKKGPGGWYDTKTKQQLMDYEVYKFVSLSSRIKQ